MELRIDWDKGLLESDGKEYSIDTGEAFDIISDAYLKIGWQNKQVYSYTWMGRPIIQSPEDMVRVQELIYKVKPDFIIETGIAHGGSLIYYAGLLKAMGGGKVVGVDIDIREHNREAMEKHELYENIVMYEGSSTDPEIIKLIEGQIAGHPSNRYPVVMVLLDACHTKQHSLEELEIYSKFVTPGSYIISCDGGIMERVATLPNAIKAEPDWATNNPKAGAEEFVKNNENFVIENVEFEFNEGNVKTWSSYWQGGVIKRIS